MVTRAGEGGSGKGELEEGKQKLQTISTRDLLKSMMTIVNITVGYTGKSLTVDPNSFHHKEKMFAPFFLLHL